MVGKRAFKEPSHGPTEGSEHHDLESGHKHRRFNGFKDAVEYAGQLEGGVAKRCQARGF